MKQLPKNEEKFNETFDMENKEAIYKEGNSVIYKCKNKKDSKFYAVEHIICTENLTIDTDFLTVKKLGYH